MARDDAMRRWPGWEGPAGGPDLPPAHKILNAASEALGGAFGQLPTIWTARGLSISWPVPNAPIPAGDRWIQHRPRDPLVSSANMMGRTGADPASVPAKGRP